ncbi:MAG: hypothetical protein N4J56_002159 [Chroococcidiopsis sp. SAG 2025]|uniref:hypothetical protein n=1 Tax=Chroococcidiopsis sp. SAG 2025 TaxID=171389 RepID=UPI00293728F2|nr:hypothetical protein [Chroococcidiopsis sp. SAG 2025]MDV2992505.1 hypothetical protein [Chroococcidiopsis sp. SAG 2025]
MKGKIIAAVGAFAALTGFASSAHAQSTQDITLSGDSLEVENLTVRDDYTEFFRRGGDRENIRLNSRNPNLSQDDGVFYDGDDGVWQISDRLELQVNEPIAPLVFPAFPRQDGASIVNDIDRAELQYELLE